jgi:hypothetical protein
MADNIEVTAGTGTTVHADEYTDATYGSGKSQQVKLADGTPGSGNKLVVNSSGEATVKATDTDALLTTIDADTSAIATDAAAMEALLTTIDADTGAMVTDLAAIEVLQTTIAGDTTSLDTKVGEVQATPTSNTVLGRLKDIDDSVQAGAVAAGTVASRSTDILSVMPAEVPTKAAVSGATSGNNTLVAAAGAGNSIVVTSLFIVAADDVDVRFEDGAGGTALTGVMSIAANSGFVLPHNPDGWFETSDNTLLNMELGGAVQVSGALNYVVR